MKADLAAVLDAAHGAVHDLVGGLDDADWQRATPCDGWSVVDVVRHLVTGERAFLIALGGVPYELSVVAAEVDALDVADLAAAWAAVASDLRAAYAAVPDGSTVPSPLGQVPADVVAEIRAIESVVHGWDLARATGRPLGLDGADLDLLVPAADRLRAGLDVARPGNVALGTPVDVPDDADAVDRLVARVGRDPRWR